MEPPAGFLHDTVLQLGDLRYLQSDDVKYEGGGDATFLGLRVTGRGLQVLGQWRRFEALVSPGTLAAVVEQLAEYAGPEESLSTGKAAALIRRIGPAGLKRAATGVGSQLLCAALELPF